LKSTENAKKMKKVEDLLSAVVEVNKHVNESKRMIENIMKLHDIQNKLHGTEVCRNTTGMSSYSLCRDSRSSIDLGGYSCLRAS